MRPIFDADLANPSFGDPGVYLDLKFERRALLFDIGDIATLPTRKLLRISDAFVTHTHIDHFCGFDHLLRVCLGRDAGVRLWGPSGLIGQVERKLEGARFSSIDRFARQTLAAQIVRDGVLLREPLFKVGALPLQHHDIASLAFAFEEATHMNVWKSRLEALHLSTGPCLTELKRQVRAGAPDDTPIRIHWRTREGSREATPPLGRLRREALVEFARDAQLLFIEAAFLDQDRDLAQGKAHLTAAAAAAGSIARAAGVARAVPFHFSPRYLGREAEMRREFVAAATPAR